MKDEGFLLELVYQTVGGPTVEGRMKVAGQEVLVGQTEVQVGSKWT